MRLANCSLEAHTDLAANTKSKKKSCIACRKPIRGKPAFMRLQVTHRENRLMERAKKLGFTSKSWNVGDSMEGAFHKQCFGTATLVWKIAFHTRALSPRR